MGGNGMFLARTGGCQRHENTFRKLQELSKRTKPNLGGPKIGEKASREGSSPLFRANILQLLEWCALTLRGIFYYAAVSASAPGETVGPTR